MKTSRLAQPANLSGTVHGRVITSALFAANPLLPQLTRACRRLVGAFSIALIAWSATASAVSLKWNPNPETNIASYRLSYGTVPGSHPNSVNSGLNTRATVTGLQEGTTYYFVVTAINTDAQESEPSDEVSYQVPITPTVPVTVIPRSGWTLQSVDSEETIGYAGTNAFDGNAATFWHTGWKSGTTPPPHEIRIDLGAVHPVNGFRYLPRQDWLLVGNISQYEFYVSLDGTNWGTPVASGTFASSSSEKEVLFVARNARYVRLRSLSEAGGGNDCNVAELNVLQDSTVNPPVNQAPVAVSKAVNATEDLAVGVILSASDADGQSLTWSIVSGPTKGTLSGTAPNLTYTPNSDTNGADSFTYKANDGSMDSNTATVSITVNAVNDAPVAVSKVAATNEDTSVSITLAGSDKEGSLLTWSIVAAPAKGTLSGTAPNLTYTPNADTNGADSFTYKANDGTTNSNTATVSITVNAVNDAPVAVSKAAATNEDTSVSITLAASDKEGSLLTWSIVAGPTKGTLSGTAPNLAYTPNADTNGADSFTYKANDGSVDSNTATVSITVNAVNDAPVAVSKAAATNEDTSVSITLAASDKEGNSLTWSIVAAPAKGTLSGTAPNLTYTPNADTNGADSFTYKANDGTTNSNTATVSITVNAVNDAPVAVSKSATTVSNTSVSIALSATDKDGNTMTYTVVASPANGTLSGTAPNLTYTPATDFLGADSFAFLANDGSVDSNTATVSINVTAKETAPPNRPPVFKSNPITLQGGTEEKSYTGISIADAASDPDKGDAITFSKVSGPEWLEISSAGRLSGTPPTGSEGMNRFTVRATDKADAYADSILLIEIAAADLPLPWDIEQLGESGRKARAAFKSGTFTLEGSGDLTGISDGGCFIWQTLSGDGSITARVNTLEDAGKIARAGLMIRDSLAENSKQAFIGVNGGGDFRWVRRTRTGGQAVIKSAGAGAIPNAWLRLTRKGDTIIACKSANGSDWTRIGSTTARFGANCYIGLSISSGKSAPSIATFRNVKVKP